MTQNEMEESKDSCGQVEIKNRETDIGSGVNSRVVFQRRKSLPLQAPNPELLQQRRPTGKPVVRKFSSNLETLQEDSIHADVTEAGNKSENSSSASEVSNKIIRIRRKHSLTYPTSEKSIQKPNRPDEPKNGNHKPSRRQSLAQNWKYSVEKSPSDLTPGPSNSPEQNDSRVLKNRRRSVTIETLGESASFRQNGVVGNKGRRLSLAHNWKLGSSPEQVPTNSKRSQDMRDIHRRCSVVDSPSRLSTSRRSSLATSLPQIYGDASGGFTFDRRRSSIKTYPFDMAPGLMARRKSNVTRRSSTVPPTPEDVTKLPKVPRLITKFSAEAQFAMLKGYEDILCDTLSRSFPEYSEDLERSVTPPCYHIEVGDSELYNAARQKLGSDSQGKIIDEVFSENKQTFPANVSSGSGAGEWKDDVKTDASKNGDESPSNKENGDSKPTFMDPVQRLVLTARYQNAQHILDEVKRSNGELVTTTLDTGTHEDGPNLVGEFNSWHSRWTKEFKFT